MPNWCHNTLTVNGSKEELTRFAEAVKSEDEGFEQPLSFERIVPQPEGLLGDDEGKSHTSPGNLDWYDWRVENWGSKWDANFEGAGVALGGEGAVVSDPAGLLSDGDSLTYSFITAWTPPEPFCKAAAKQFPELTLTLTYAEPGNEFAGRLTVKGESVVEEVELKVEDVLAEEDRWF